jgi:hypothetical protein
MKNGDEKEQIVLAFTFVAHRRKDTLFKTECD